LTELRKEGGIQTDEGKISNVGIGDVRDPRDRKVAEPAVRTRGDKMAKSRGGDGNGKSGTKRRGGGVKLSDPKKAKVLIGK
jgi:hypothetical protein